MAKKDKEEADSVGMSSDCRTEMLAQIDELADQERRTRGNMVRILLEDALKDRQK